MTVFVELLERLAWGVLPLTKGGVARTNEGTLVEAGRSVRAGMVDSGCVEGQGLKHSMERLGWCQ